ncbi:amidohydrolase/deacetylase family metallohydrolase [Dyadobacter sp. CY261]|uniref:amidohydrolase/deacetylase family metallohydrolase n=1 Tax=Dyadobacter sp. CY261 TaxID=2907203 RepID=UPI001F414FDE|nr:amidohydrolase/deacetylase family metallohydrolase [Dyadobacter sp. CY261]MCF0071394.1 amidohydrolase/deacetylase family metallohydrolase [Dyadobacter sp. CY261]
MKLIHSHRLKFIRFLAVSLLIPLLTGLSNAQSVDLLLKGGHVIDPKNRIDGVMDVAVTAGKIVRVAADIPVSDAKRVVDAKGLYVAPGFIDMHVHVFNGTTPDAYIANGHTSVAPDGFTFRTGVTTVVDAGSSGWRNFKTFKAQTIDRAQTRVLAFLNIVGTGMASRFEEQDMSDMNPVMTANMIKRLYPNIIVGIKSAHYWGDYSQVQRAVEAGKLADVPVIVDFGEHRPPLSIEKLFREYLRPGDIFTHTYAHGPTDRETVVDEQGKVKPFVLEMQKKGIVFDVGHGGGAFAWRQAIPSIKQGFLANVISTDLHTDSMNGGMKGLDNVISKFLNMGVTLSDAILRVTWNPAQVIKRPELGSLTVGSEADITIFSVRTGNFGFIDARRLKLKGDKKLEAELTIRAGKVVWDLNGISVAGWESEMQGK